VVAGLRTRGIMVYRPFAIMPRRQHRLEAKNRLFSKVSTTGPRQFRHPLILIKKVGAKSLSKAIFDE